jgi:hypothetical protein
MVSEIENKILVGKEHITCTCARLAEGTACKAIGKLDSIGDVI